MQMKQFLLNENTLIEGVKHAGVRLAMKGFVFRFCQVSFQLSRGFHWDLGH